MKTTLYSLFALTFLFLGCTNNVNETEFINTDNLVLLKINSKTNKQELVKIKQELKETKSIDLDIDGCVFDQNNMITKVDLKISTADGYNGTVTSSRTGLYNLNYGFMRDYTEGASTAFKTGNF